MIHRLATALCIGTFDESAKALRSSRRGVLNSGALLLAMILLASSPASAQKDNPSPASPSPASPSSEQLTLMKVLTEHGLHDIEHENWNAYGQFTYISSWKKRFRAPYTNKNGSINSLIPDPERSFTGTTTLYLGAGLWKGAEGYLAPEVISERGFSQLRGLGGAIQNFELQKGGTETPQVYRSRAYIRQTFGLGGKSTAAPSGPLQLGRVYDSRRLVLTAGNFSILDFLDKNAFGIDPRQGFFSLAFLTYPAYDFAADSRGYSWGGVAELDWDEWAVRLGRTTPPKNPNQQPVDFRLGRHHGDQMELEHKHRVFGQEGSVRVIAYRNRENIGRFGDAVAAFEADPQKNATTCPGFNYGSENASAPDLCWVRKPNAKVGIGVFGEQRVGHDIGVFTRAMFADGRTEVDAYTSTDRSASFGALAKGSLWSRSADLTGVGVNLGWISRSHAEYLRLGGIDGFIGDGAIKPGIESTLDVFYSASIRRWLWLSGDYQHVINPAFNADRGPVNIFSLRIHGEF
jgi:high affinity Mn2+ porin